MGEAYNIVYQGEKIYNLHKKNRNNNDLTITLIICSVFALMVAFSTVTMSIAHAQTAYPTPEHTHAYLMGAKNGFAAAKVGQYNVGAACTPFTGNDLNHCIAGYYDVVAGYHDAKVAMHSMNVENEQGNATTTGGINMTKTNASNVTGSKGS
jgi:hypothetical protein